MWLLNYSKIFISGTDSNTLESDDKKSKKEIVGHLCKYACNSSPTWTAVDQQTALGAHKGQHGRLTAATMEQPDLLALFLESRWDRKMQIGLLNIYQSTISITFAGRAAAAAAAAG